MVRSMRVLLATTVALSLGVVGVVVACPGGDGAGTKAQAKSAKTTLVSAKAKSGGCSGHGTKASRTSAKVSLTAGNAKGTGDGPCGCGGNCGGNCQDGCAHGSKAGHTSTKVSLTSAKAEGKGGCHGIEGAKRTVKITPTGVIIEITGENPTAIAALHARFSKMQNVVKTVSAKP